MRRGALRPEGRGRLAGGILRIDFPIFSNIPCPGNPVKSFFAGKNSENGPTDPGPAEKRARPAFFGETGKIFPPLLCETLFLW